MRGFFLPQPASWPGAPFAPLRMTSFSLTTTEASSASLWKNRSRDLLRGIDGDRKAGAVPAGAVVQSAAVGATRFAAVVRIDRHRRAGGRSLAHRTAMRCRDRRDGRA